MERFSLWKILFLTAIHDQFPLLDHFLCSLQVSPIVSLGSRNTTQMNLVKEFSEMFIRQSTIQPAQISKYLRYFKCFRHREYLDGYQGASGRVASKCRRKHLQKKRTFWAIQRKNVAEDGERKTVKGLRLSNNTRGKLKFSSGCSSEDFV